MSHEASAWAMNRRLATPAHKLVLLVLADLQDEKLGYFHPGYDRLESLCCMSSLGVREVVLDLAWDGYIDLLSSSSGCMIRIPAARHQSEAQG